MRPYAAAGAGGKFYMTEVVGGVAVGNVPLSGSKFTKRCAAEGVAYTDYRHRIATDSLTVAMAADATVAPEQALRAIAHGCGWHTAQSPKAMKTVSKHYVGESVSKVLDPMGASALGVSTPERMTRSLVGPLPAASVSIEAVGAPLAAVRAATAARAAARSPAANEALVRVAAAGEAAVAAVERMTFDRGEFDIGRMLCILGDREVDDDARDMLRQCAAYSSEYFYAAQVAVAALEAAMHAAEQVG